MIKNKAIAVVGPTASGKTSLSIKLALNLNCNIISCDSVQIYKYLDIGSAKPTQEERKLVTHEMLDIYDPDFRVNVALYKKMAESHILNTIKSKKIPIICGGTGMYFNALYFGLFKEDSSDNELRGKLYKRLNEEGNILLYNELREKDPQTAEKVSPNDIRRIIRALEVFYSTGKTLSELQNSNERLNLDWFVIGLTTDDRQSLYDNINQRVDFMINQGVIEETEFVMKKFGENAYALGSIGYRHCRDYILGKIKKDRMIELYKRDTRRYAKRQFTWFKKNKAIKWYKISDYDKIIHDLTEFLS